MEKVRREKMQLREKVGKSLALEGRKVGSLKRRVRSQLMNKLHAVVAQGIFEIKKWQSTPGSDNFWKLRC